MKVQFDMTVYGVGRILQMNGPMKGLDGGGTAALELNTEALPRQEWQRALGARLLQNEAVLVTIEAPAPPTPAVERCREKLLEACRSAAEIVARYDDLDSALTGLDWRRLREGFMHYEEARAELEAVETEPAVDEGPGDEDGANKRPQLSGRA